MSTARESGKESKHTVNDEPHKEDAENIRHGDNQSIFHTIFPSMSIGLHIAACRKKKKKQKVKYYLIQSLCPNQEPSTFTNNL